MQFQCCHNKKNMEQSPSSNQTGLHFTSLGLELTYIHYYRLQLGHQSRQHSCTFSATPHTTVAKVMVAVNHTAKFSCEHCCSPRNRRWSQRKMHKWTGVIVIQPNDPTPIQVVNSIHMAEIDLPCMTVGGKWKCRIIHKGTHIQYAINIQQTWMHAWGWEHRVQDNTGWEI